MRLLATVLLIIPLPLMQAEIPVAIQELIRSETVYPQEKGEIQITLAPQLSREGKTSYLAPVVVEYGITDSLQISFEWEKAHLRPAFGIQRSFMNVRGSDTHLAIGFETAAAENRPYLVIARDVRRWNAQLFATGSLKLERAVTSNVEREDERMAQWGLGGFFRLGPVAIANELSVPGKQVYWTPGVIWRSPTRKVWEIAFGTSIGLTSQSTPFSLVMKITQEFDGPRLFGR